MTLNKFQSKEETSENLNFMMLNIYFSEKKNRVVVE